MPNEPAMKNLDKALELLRYLSRQDEPQNVAQLSRYLGVTRNTIYAMLTSLQSFHFVEKSADGFLAGYGLQELSRRLETPISLQVYKSPLNCLRLYNTENSLSSGLVHACTTAPGKLLLAAQPDEVIRADLAERPIEAYTDKTITDPAEVLAQVQMYRTAEFAIERGERYPGSGTIAVPIRNRNDEVIAALSIFFYNMTDEHKMQSDLSQLRLCGLKISQELGSARATLI